MNPLVVSWAYDLLDDMVDVGVRQWFLYAVSAFILGFALGEITAIAYIAGAVFGILFSAATILTYWWQSIGRKKHVGVSIEDLGRAKQQRRDDQ